MSADRVQCVDVCGALHDPGHPHLAGRCAAVYHDAQREIRCGHQRHTGMHSAELRLVGRSSDAAHVAGDVVTAYVTIRWESPKGAV